MKILVFKGSFNFLLVISVFFLVLSFWFCLNKVMYIVEWSIISVNSVPVLLTFVLDWMSCLFIFIVLIISSAVMNFCKIYMSDEVYKDRFCYLLLLFILSMVLFIVSPNLITILLGWDGLGLVSFLLVVYYQNMKSLNAGMLTILTNRVGDVALFLAIVLMMNHGNWNFFTMSFNYDVSIMDCMCVMMIFAGITKSAQMPFSAWLPAAMAAPTPVSTLVHSSTLVTAGVFLLVRFSDYFFFVSWFQFMLLLLSSMTMMMASFVAYFEYDVKKIIALSTLSQLGLMMSIISFGYFNLAVFHLFTHAIFKALLFICAGSLIYNYSHFQDIRMIGCVTNQMPVISICMNSANFALCGFPFLAGFYSKDLIYEMINVSGWNVISFVMLFIATMFTVMYSLRMTYYSFWSFNNLKSFNSINDEGVSFNGSAFFMSFGAVVFGAVMNWMIFSYPNCIELVMYMKLLTVMMIVFGLFFSLSKYIYQEVNKFVMFNVTCFMSQMWFFPILSTQSMLNMILKVSKITILDLDQGWYEWYGPQGSFIMLSFFSSVNQSMVVSSLKKFLLISLVFMLMYVILLF